MSKLQLSLRIAQFIAFACIFLVGGHGVGNVALLIAMQLGDGRMADADVNLATLGELLILASLFTAGKNPIDGLVLVTAIALQATSLVLMGFLIGEYAVYTWASAVPWMLLSLFLLTSSIWSYIRQRRLPE
jgi:hypothetical protein